jgi:hypothetical protein
MAALKLGTEQFACRDTLPAWQLMKLAKAMQSDDDMTRLAGMYDFLNGVVLPADRARLDKFMADYDGADPLEDLDTAIGALMESYAGRPIVPPSSSQDGRTPSTGTSRVVSLSRAKTPTSADGRSVAS